MYSIICREAQTDANEDVMCLVGLETRSRCCLAERLARTPTINKY